MRQVFPKHDEEGRPDLDVSCLAFRELAGVVVFSLGGFVGLQEQRGADDAALGDDEVVMA